jgi:thioredoxin-dependent peroxiredoxin
MLQVGQLIPDFALANQDEEIIHLKSYRGQRVVIFTSPKPGSIACTMQAVSLRDVMPRLAQANTVVLGISTDRTPVLKTWKERESLPFDLLSDPDHQVLERLGAWGIAKDGFTLEATNRTLWIVDEVGRLFEKHVPVGLQNGTIALKALDQMNGELLSAAGGR